MLPVEKRSKIYRKEPILKFNFEKSLIHASIICDSCDGPIIGTRYMCTNCPNFDICEKCENEKPDCHYRDHALLKCRYALPLKTRVQLPTICPPQPQTITTSRNAKPLEITSKLSTGTKPSVEISIRAMKLSDLDSVIQIENESFFSPYNKDFFVKCLHYHSKMTISVAINPMSTPPFYDVVGYICFYVKSKDLKVVSLAVASRSRGLGVGGLLLSKIIVDAKANGAKTSSLHVSVFNQPAQALYKKYGYAPVQWLSNYYSDEKEDALYMKLQLKGG